MKNLKKEFLTTYIAGAVLLAGIVILISMILNNLNIWRVDLTANQIYKLSPSVSKILTQLEAPIEITYYVSSSEKMPTQWKNLERDVIDKLEELQMASKGKLSYKVFDPSKEEEKEAFEEKEAKESGENLPTRKKIAERLYEKGVIPFGVQSAQRDEFAIKRVYSSLVLSYLDRKEDVIPEVRPESFGSLEYEIISRIYKLISNKKPKIGFYPSQPEQPQGPRNPYQQQIPDMYKETVQLLEKQGYDVTRTNIKKDDPIPEDITTMLVMADQPLEERQLYEIDKLIHNGVHVILAGQTYNYQVSPMRGQPGEFMLQGMPSRINLNDLTKVNGIELDGEMFMDRSTAHIQVPVYQNRNLGFMTVREQRLEPVTKPVMIRVTPENINRKFSISNKINDIFYMYGTRLIINEPLLKEREIKSHILFTSSDYSWTRSGYGYGPVNTDPPEANMVLKHQPLAVYLEGQFKAKYETGNIPKWRPAPDADAQATDEEAEIPTELEGEGKENKLIILGCSNIFKSDMINSIPSHQALLINCVDALTLGEDLINIRSKNIAARRIKETSTTEKNGWKFFVVWVPAIVFVILGWQVNRNRKKRKAL